MYKKMEHHAFRSGDTHTYSTSRADLKRGIKKAKQDHKLSVEEHFVNSDPWRMWQGITCTDHHHLKSSNSTQTVTSVNFDKDNKDKFTKTEAPGIHQTLTLSTTVVNDALSKINTRKAAVPDDIPGRVFSACAEQLVGVFTDTLNLSQD